MNRERLCFAMDDMTDKLDLPRKFREMVSMPTEQKLMQTLSAAGRAHHEYESNFLNGVRDEQWAGWYSAYVLGCLGEFTTPTLLTQWLEAVSGEGDWSKNAAAHVLSSIGAV